MMYSLHIGDPLFLHHRNRLSCTLLVQGYDVTVQQCHNSTYGGATLLCRLGVWHYTTPDIFVLGEVWLHCLSPAGPSSSTARMQSLTVAALQCSRVMTAVLFFCGLSLLQGLVSWARSHSIIYIQ